MDEKKKIEAVLFAAGDKISEEEISRLTKIEISDINKYLKELKEDYKRDQSAFIVIDEGDKWKLTVREEFMPIVQKIVPHTELSRTIMSTLAVIAWKAPVLQSDIIKIRTNKAYDHIKELMEMGFIIKQKHGRSYLIKLAQKFFEYFDLSGKEDVKEKFQGFEDISEANVVLEGLEESTESGLEEYGPDKLGELEIVDESESEQVKEQSEGQSENAKVEVFEEPEPKPHVEVYDKPQESSKPEEESSESIEEEADQEIEGEDEVSSADVDALEKVLEGQSPSDDAQKQNVSDKVEKEQE